jgi:hypothetical protein
MTSWAAVRLEVRIAGAQEATAADFKKVRREQGWDMIEKPFQDGRMMMRGESLITGNSLWPESPDFEYSRANRTLARPATFLGRF